MHVLIYDKRIEIPDGRDVVKRGVVQLGDRAYDPELPGWAEEIDDDYFGTGDDVRDFYCVIRRAPKEPQ